MSTEQELHARSNSKCELCGATDNLSAFEVEPKNEHIFVCSTCSEQIINPDKVDVNHWRCLNDSMWSEIPAVQVIAWRMLTRLRAEGWPQDLLDMLYLDDDTLEWAKATGEGEEKEERIVHRDSNGAILQSGDSVVLIKDLKVKGANFIAKRGEAVRNMTVVHDNAEQIEGKVSGQHIVILTQYVKK